MSFAGSCERDLIESKIWLCHNLPKKNYGWVYVLGSWYGNMGLVMRKMNIRFIGITNIDSNKSYTVASKKLYKLANFDRPYQNIAVDCNKYDFQDADLIINTSTNDIRDNSWLNKVPKNCTVAIQSRNNQPMSMRMDKPYSFENFLDMYPLRIYYSAGVKKMTNNDETYYRYMLIGTK